MDRLRLGMIGCGEIAVRTAAAIADSQHAQHVMLMDTKAELARDLGEKYGVPWTDSVDALLSNPEVNAVYIAVPHHLHATIAIQAANAGKHILVEKPIATTVADGEAMIAAARDNGVWLSVNFHAQVDPLCQMAKQLISAGAIGQVIGTRIVFRGDKPSTYWTSGYSGRVPTDWRTRKDTAAGGVLIMNGIHNLNTMRYVTGLEVDRVYAEYGTFATPVEVEDLISLTYRYRNGAIGSLEAGSVIRGRGAASEVDRIYGTDGQLTLSERGPLSLYTTVPATGFPTNEWSEIPLTPLTIDQHKTEMVDGFAGPILSGETPAVSAEDGLAALAIVLAAYQSGTEERPIHLA